MRVIPVLDLLNRVVVRGVAGRRSEYRPIHSRLTLSCEPVDVARAIRDRFGLDQLYVADLDGILHELPARDVMRELADDGFQLWVDGGVRTAWEVEAALAAGATKVIIGLESWPLLSSLEILIGQVGPERLIFSLDLKDGLPVRVFPDMPATDPLEIGAAVITAGLEDLLVLDLASVGTGQGVPTLDLCRALHAFAGQLRLTTGGGVRSMADLELLRAEPIEGLLVASALHDGSITPAALQHWMAALPG